MSPELRSTFSLPLMRRNFVVALVVGTLLTAINQGDVLLSTGQVDAMKAVLTYCVPFLVASYGSYNSLRSLARIAERRRAAGGE
jgi:methyl-accepting chemotaxis protein